MCQSVDALGLILHGFFFDFDVVVLGNLIDNNLLID
jgi:putative cofactor-binding repeat protein